MSHGEDHDLIGKQFTHNHERKTFQKRPSNISIGRQSFEKRKAIRSFSDSLSSNVECCEKP